MKRRVGINNAKLIKKTKKGQWRLKDIKTSHKKHNDN